MPELETGMTGTLHRALLNRYALGTALALVIAPFATIERAEAACDQTSPINNATVNCTGMTNNANGTIGFGTLTDNGNTINVVAFATVSGTDTGIGFNNGTVNNSGTITGGSFGIFGNTATIVNSGSITTTVTNADAVAAFTLNLTNSGNIAALGDNSKGVSSSSSGATVTNTGTITANGVESFGMSLAGTDLVNNSGTISAQGSGGIGIQGGGLTLTNSGQIQAANIGVLGNAAANVTNTGGAVITASGVNGIGVSAGISTIINNAGQITATDATGIGVKANVDATVTNTGGASLISGGAFGIEATGITTVVNNAGGKIEATGVNGVAIGSSDTTPVNTVTLSNAGTIQANGNGGTAILGQTVNVTNTGSTSVISGTTGIAAVTVNVIANAGTISGGARAIDAVNAVTMTSNTGTISSTNDAIRAATVTVTSNAGTISSMIGDAIHAIGTGTATVTNSGSITGADAIFAVTTAKVTNFGAITANNGVGVEAIQSATITNTGSTSVISGTTTGIAAATVNVIANAGTISGTNFGINATKTANITNNAGGTIQATGAAGVAIGSSDPTPVNTVTLANAGTIKGGDGAGIQAQTVNITSNSGTISADGAAIVATGAVTIVSSGQITSKRIAIQNSTNAAANVTNSGVISGLGGMAFAGGGSVMNSGAISGTSFAAISFAGPSSITNLAGGTITSGSLGAIHTGSGNLTVNNAGTISGKIGIVAGGAATITNSGTIQRTAGATGTAIQLSSAADTLNIKSGSSIIGLIDMGHGADVINVDSAASSVPKGVSMLSRATSAVVDALKQQLENFDGVINIIGGGSPSLQPTVTVNGRTASLDPTALAQQDRTLMDFTGGMSSMVQGRLGGAATGSGPMAMSYAMEDARAEMFIKAPATSWNAPVNVWSSAFGATRSQNGTDSTLDSTSSVYGGVIGVDRRIRPNWLVGLFAGGGSGTLNVALNSQKVDSDYFSGGVYSRFEWASQFFDTTLQAGGVNNRSTRLLQNNIAGGLENATASYNGWFISPEVAYGYRINLGNGTMVTPTARLRYVAGFFDGYTETGSAQTLTIGSRTLQDFEERGEVEVSKTGFFGDPALKGSFHGGVIALQRAGDTTVNAVLIGQNLSFITPGKSSAVGAVGGVSFDYHVTPNVALFGAIEGMMMSDESRIGSAKGGLRVAF
jgi:uncharacterized protein with beta-barrel porin domain